MATIGGGESWDLRSDYHDLPPDPCRSHLLAYVIDRELMQLPVSSHETETYLMAGTDGHFGQIFQGVQG